MVPRLAAVLAVSALALVGCGDNGTKADDQRPANGHVRQSGGSTPASEEPSGTPSSSAPAATMTTVPVYFVGDTPDGPRLYREFRRVDDSDPLGGALTLAASGDALDPDYRTLLPKATFGTDGSASVPLPDDSWTRRPAGMSETEALLAVQQLVYTAQGVLQQRSPITFTDSGGNATQIFGIASEDGFTAADPIRTLALVNVTSPEEGATVKGSFKASGVSSSFEANTPWEVRDSSGKVVQQGAATAEGWMDKLYPWEASVDVSALAPGRYTFVAMTDDPSGGEGSGPSQDTKTITVQ